MDMDSWPGGVTQRCRTAVVEARMATMVDDRGVPPKVRARAGSVWGALGGPAHRLSVRFRWDICDGGQGHQQ